MRVEHVLPARALVEVLVRPCGASSSGINVAVRRAGAVRIHVQASAVVRSLQWRQRPPAMLNGTETSSLPYELDVAAEVGQRRAGGGPIRVNWRCVRASGSGAR